MEEREKIIQLWFDMWSKAADMGLKDIFADDAVYIESWGPEYHGLAKINHWFTEWNTRGKVLQWDIKQFFHSESQTVVEWCFIDQMNNGTVEAFDGVSIIQWADNGKIACLQEFGCNKNRYDPYENSDIPSFSGEKAKWF